MAQARAAAWSARPQGAAWSARPQGAAWSAPAAVQPRRPRRARVQERAARLELRPPAQAEPWPVAETLCQARETPAGGSRLPSEPPVWARPRVGPRETPPPPRARRQDRKSVV